MTRTDRYAMQLALCRIRTDRSLIAAEDVLARGGEVSRAVWRGVRGLPTSRVTRVRLALLLRAMLRAEPEPPQERFDRLLGVLNGVLADARADREERRVLRDAVREYLDAAGRADAALRAWTYRDGSRDACDRTLADTQRAIERLRELVK